MEKSISFETGCHGKHIYFLMSLYGIKSDSNDSSNKSELENKLGITDLNEVMVPEVLPEKCAKSMEMFFSSWSAKLREGSNKSPEAS